MCGTIKDMNIIEHLYNIGLMLKRDRGLKLQRRLCQRVISVGNITLGGTGKTPLVIALAQEALRLGLRPCILTRGYRGKTKGPCHVCRGNGPILDVVEAGDEPVLMAMRLPQVEVIKGPDRYEAAQLSQGADIFILDDGFQHFGLYRDIDIVLVDCLRGFGNGRLFPVGPLREPIAQLTRANIIVTTRNDNIGNDNPGNNLITTLCNRAGVAYPSGITTAVYNAQHRPTSLRTTDGLDLPLSMIAGQRVFAFCGIGNPNAFRLTLQSTGADIAGMLTFPDHHRYNTSDLKKIFKKSSDAQWIITTEKDIIKIVKLAQDQPTGKLLCLLIDIDIDRGFYKRVF
ncbi:MAG: tetraacyldisaccharide 4'-kinase [Nitrospirae bacterium]|nr:tetraacyldisaccharide 4'-kinase [Nitrospirota bacterium]